MALPALLRRVALLESISQDARFAARSLRLRPGFSALVTITLALGIGATALMFGILDRLLFRAPEHIREPERVVQILLARTGGPATGNSSQPYVLYKDMAALDVFQSVGATTPSTVVNRAYYPLGRGRDATRIAGAQVSPSYFTTLGVRPHLGRFFQEDEAGEKNPGKLAVIGYGFWQRHFGGRDDVVGQTIDLGLDRYTVVGVTPEGFTGAELSDVDVWLPIAAADALRFVKGADWSTTRSSQWMHIFARLAPGVSAEQASAAATAAYRATHRALATSDRGRARVDSTFVMLGSVIPGRSAGGFGMSSSSDVVRVARLLGVVSLLVLLLACANVANLLLVRALNRRREIALRLALGVSRARLSCQLLIEGLLLALVGALGGIVVVLAGSTFVRRLLLGDSAWSGSAVDARVLAMAAVAAVFTALITSLLPIAQATKPAMSGALRAGARGGVAPRSRTRSALLAMQTALALVLLAGAGMFLRSLRQVAELPLGVDTDKVVVASIEHVTVGLSNAEAKELYLRFAERVRAVPGIQQAAVAIAHSFGLGWGTQVLWRGDTLRLPDQGFSQYAVTPEYFEVMGVRLVRGRLPVEGDRVGTELVAVVNETAANAFWPAGNAIGQCVRVGADSMPCTTIVGVVTNARRQRLVEDPLPQIYRPLAQVPASQTDGVVSFFGLSLLARAEHPAAVVEPLRRTMQSTSANVPYANVRTLEQQMSRQVRSWRLGATMFTVFGVLALIIAAIGLYGVVAFTMAQRRHEYAVRLALGASARHVAWITAVHGLLPTAVGLVVGTALVLAGGRLVSSLLFQTSAREPSVLATMVALLLATAALASLVPGLRAARTNPMDALRAE